MDRCCVFLPWWLLRASVRYSKTTRTLSVDRGAVLAVDYQLTGFTPLYTKLLLNFDISVSERHVDKSLGLGDLGASPAWTAQTFVRGVHMERKRSVVISDGWQCGVDSEERTVMGSKMSEEGKTVLK